MNRVSIESNPIKKCNPGYSIEFLAKGETKNEGS